MGLFLAGVVLGALANGLLGAWAWAVPALAVLLVLVGEVLWDRRRGASPASGRLDRTGTA